MAQISREPRCGHGMQSGCSRSFGLSHDLGHPPFGHNGEDAPDEAAERIVEGKCPKLLVGVLTPVEPKVTDSSGEPPAGPI